MMEYDCLCDGLQPPLRWTTTTSVLDYECASYLGYDHLVYRIRGGEQLIRLDVVHQYFRK